MSWRTRIRLLRSRVKWPGWAMIVWSIFWWTPELYGKVDFWLNTAREIGGRLGQIAAVITSPWFNLALMLAGILWLCFVGESRYAIRYPVMPYVGWSLVGLLALAFWSVLVAGYVASRVSQQGEREAEAQIDNLTQTNQQLQQKVEVLEKQTLPRVVTPEQKKKLREAISKVPQGTSHRLVFEVTFDCAGCSAFVADLVSVWDGFQEWKVQVTINISLNAQVKGVQVGSDEECPWAEAQLISGILQAGEVNHLLGRMNSEDRKKLSIPSGFCPIVVGPRT